MGRVVFYARVSTKDQKLDLQLDAARSLGVKTANIFVEKASSVRHDWPALSKAIAALQPGDTLACYKLDRIGRSLVHVTKLLAELEELYHRAMPLALPLWLELAAPVVLAYGFAPGPTREPLPAKRKAKRRKKKRPPRKPPAQQALRVVND